MSLSVYNFARVSCIVNAVPMVDFWDGDDVVKVIPAVDSATPLVGADGKAIVSISLDESAIIEIRLKPGSPSNGVLSALELAFRKSLRAVPFPVAVSNYQDFSITTAPECVVLQRAPEESYGKAATARVWRIFAANAKRATIGQI